MDNTENKMTLETAGAELDALIARLENTTLPLSESVEVYTQACKLLAFCMSEVQKYREKTDSAFEQLSPYLNGEGTQNA